MDDILKGNFKVKNPVVVKDDDPAAAPENRHREISRELRKRALATLGGSLVYVERTDLAWDGASSSDEQNDERK